MKNLIFVLIVFSSFQVSCQNNSGQVAPSPAKEQEMPVVGGDKDANGCKGSAGYQWSTVRNECIRVFESGIRLNPKAADLDTTVSAFIVFKSDVEDEKVELFLPGNKESILLNKVKMEDAGTWKGGDSLTLTQWKGMYSLMDKNKRVLYEGSAN